MAEKEFDLQPYGLNQTKRLTIPAAEEILFVPFECLDHGYVRLIDYMGGDERVVQAARVSYGKGTKTVSEDRVLLRYLKRHEHTTPSEQPRVQMHVKTPLCVAREWYRHRTGTYASFNEYSLRYSEPEEDYWVIDRAAVGMQDLRNRQGRIKDNVSDELKEFTREQLIENSEQALKRYKELISRGVSREIARNVLSFNFYTTFYWSMDLHNMFHFLGLRMDSHALEEFRVYAVTVGDMVKRIFPVSYGAFEDYVFNSIRFSELELKVVKYMLGGGYPSFIFNPSTAFGKVGLKGRELEELEAKLERIRTLELPS